MRVSVALLFFAHVVAEKSSYDISGDEDVHIEDAKQDDDAPSSSALPEDGWQRPRSIAAAAARWLVEIERKHGREAREKFTNGTESPVGNLMARAIELEKLDASSTARVAFVRVFVKLIPPALLGPGQRSEGPLHEVLATAADFLGDTKDHPNPHVAAKALMPLILHFFQEMVAVHRDLFDHDTEVKKDEL